MCIRDRNKAIQDTITKIGSTTVSKEGYAHKKGDKILQGLEPVSYTHLDVYKRQAFMQLIQQFTQGQAGPEAPQGEPVYRKGGKLVGVYLVD